MKEFLFPVLVLLFAINGHAQFYKYYAVDTARLIILNAKTPEDKFYGYYGLDRYYYSSGLYDSSEIVQKEMYEIAKKLNRDSLLTDVNLAISNKYLNKQDINLALVHALKALDYANENFRKSRVYINIAGVYAWNGNYETALQYLRKYDALGSYPHFALFKNMMYGMVFNGMGMPDSALIYLVNTEEGYKFRRDVFGYAQSLNQYAKAYELKGDTDLADVFYKKTLAYCVQEKVSSFYVVACNNYCNFLLSNKNYDKAKSLAAENLIRAKQGGNLNGVANAADILQKIYGHISNKDSAYYYAVMQIAFKDSVSNQKRIYEFQNITFAQKLREIDEQAKLKEETTQRKQNIQYALIALSIITLIIIFLLLSRSFITNTKVIKFLGAVALLIVFEFLNLLLHPFLEDITHHTPVLMLLGLVCIAALLVPFHHRIEKWANEKLVEKNKKIRFADAKKTIEELDKSSDS